MKESILTGVCLLATILWGCTVSRYSDVTNATSAVIGYAGEQYRPYQFDNGDDYVSDGLYRIVDSRGRIGYAAPDGTVAIKPRFAFGYPFAQGRARVTDSGCPDTVPGSGGEYHVWISDSWYWIDKSGSPLQ